MIAPQTKKLVFAKNNGNKPKKCGKSRKSKLIKFFPAVKFSINMP